MEVIAKALVQAVQFIADRDVDAGEDQDVEMLEQIAAVLRDATTAERLSLIAAADSLGLESWPEQIGIDRE